MLSQIQHQIIVDFTKTYLEDFLHYLCRKTPEIKILIALFKSLLAKPIDEKSYIELKNYLAIKLNDKESEFTITSGLDDLLLLLQGKFNLVKGNIGNDLKRYAADPRLSPHKNQISNEDITQVLQQVLPECIPDKIRNFCFEEKLLNFPLQEKLDYLFNEINYSFNISLNQSSHLYRTLLHDFYRDYASKFISYQQAFEWGKWVSCFITQLNNLLLLGANTDHTDIFDNKPLDYLIEALPHAVNLRHKLAIEDVLRRISTLYNQFMSGFSEYQKKRLTDKGYNLLYTDQLTYAEVLLPQSALLPSDISFINALKESLVECFYSPKAGSLSENDQACLRWLTEEYINISLTSCNVTADQLVTHKETLIKAVLSNTKEAPDSIAELLEKIAQYDCSSFSSCIDTQLSNFFLDFHNSLISQNIAIADASSINIDILTQSFRKISASIKIKEALRRAAKHYPKTDLRWLYLTYLAMLKTATDPGQAYDRFCKNIHLLMRGYLINQLSQSKIDFWDVISDLLRKKLQTNTWFWTISTKLIYPINSYRDFPMFLFTKQHAIENHLLNQEQAITSFYLRYRLRRLSGVTETTLDAILPWNQSNTQLSQLPAYLKTVSKEHSNLEIAYLVKCILNNNTCEISSPNESMLAAIACVVNIVCVTLYERYLEEYPKAVKHFLNKLNFIQDENEKLDIILDSMIKSASSVICSMPDDADNTEELFNRMSSTNASKLNTQANIIKYPTNVSANSLFRENNVMNNCDNKEKAIKSETAAITIKYT